MFFLSRARTKLLSFTFLGLGAAGVSAACSVLVDADVVQCNVDSDCAGRGLGAATCANAVCVSAADASLADAAPESAPVDPKWGCLGSIKYGTQDIEAPKVLFRQRFVRFLGEAPVTQMNVSACGRLDPDCAVPLGTATTDDAGYLNLMVPKFFEGYLSLSPPSTFATMVPSLVAVIPPPEKDADPAAVIPGRLAAHLTSNGEINALLQGIGASVDPALSNILGLAVDCQGNPASGVSLRIEVKDKKTVSYYTDYTGTPSVTAQETADRGEGGFVNTPTGPVTIEATVTSLNKRLGRYTVITKAGHITYLPMSPGPS